MALLRPDTITPKECNLNDSDSERRKLTCMAAVRQREAMEGAKAAKLTVRSKIALNLFLLKIKICEGAISEKCSQFNSFQGNVPLSFLFL